MTTDERLAAIEARLDRLTALLEPAAGVARQVEPAIAMTIDSIDAWAAGQQARGVDLDARVQLAAALLERLTEPAAAGRLERLVELLPRLAPLAELAATFEATAGMALDTFDEQVRRLDARGIDVEARLAQALGLAERLTEPASHAHLGRLLDAAPGLMGAVPTGEIVGRAVAAAVAAAPAPIGLFGLLGALSKPEVQRALGFAVAIAERVGRDLPLSTSTRT